MKNKTENTRGELLFLSQKKCKTAFTLAEVLITLAVIGVVAVLAIGIFMPKIQDKVLAAQTKTAMIKFTKAMEQMALNNKIGPFYHDTEEFVSELGNYLKLAKVCKNDKLADCFGYEEFADIEGKAISFEDIKDGKGFNLPKNSTSDFEGNTTGIVTIDGTPMILAWNKKCEILEPGVYEWSGDTNKSTGCVAAVMDVNGTKRPDKLGKDVALLNASSLGPCIKFTVNGTTYRWGCPFLPNPLNRTQCLELLNEGKILSCADANHSVDGKNFWTYWGGDRWAGAVQTCGGGDKLPSKADLTALAIYLYDAAITDSDTGSTHYNCPNGTECLDRKKAAALNRYISNHIPFFLYSNNGYNPAYASVRDYYFGSTNSYGDRRCGSWIHAVCKW